jgi:energy-coupling factor transporter ATP-binding protein EcfA2
MGNRALSNFSIAADVTFRQQSFTILLGGTSGCGKSTLASFLASRYDPFTRAWRKCELSVLNVQRLRLCFTLCAQDRLHHRYIDRQHSPHDAFVHSRRSSPCAVRFHLSCGRGHEPARGHGLQAEGAHITS